jgi:lipopolysaccharide transport system ATP-binding protein
MSSSAIALRLRDVSKSYPIRHNVVAATTLAEAVVARVRHPLARQAKEIFWALRDVSLDVSDGEVVGIIGANGAGKSTLLKVITRITAPTTGIIDVYGRVGSLLEVGTGFHPELTGRENIFLNGAILGMRRREIALAFDEIVAFAGIERFLDTPVKRYSSGMYVRLAFAVAAHLRSDILVIDEVLAVGDPEFQSRCLSKMRDVAQGGRTVLFVSHNLPSVGSLCQRALWLRSGELAFDGPAVEALGLYTRSFAELKDAVAPPRGGSGEVRVSHVALTKPVYDPAEPKTLSLRLERKRPLAGPFFVTCHVNDETGRLIVHLDSRHVGVWLDAREHQEVHLTIDSPWLKPGSYFLDIFVCHPFGILDAHYGACRLDVSSVLPYHGTGLSQSSPATVLADYRFRVTDPEAASGVSVQI